MDTKANKTTVKKPSSKVRDKKLQLSDGDLDHFRDLLLKKRREILGSVDEMQNEAFRQSLMDAAGDLSRMPIHMADQGTDTNQQEVTVGLMDNERKLIKKIDKALTRINEKSYGICIATGKAIAKARLEAKPWASYSVEYARKIELGQAPGI